jgi:hypothetical protein
MARRRLTDGSEAPPTLALSGVEFEPILAHLAWLAEVEASWGRAKLPLGWAFRVYNGAVLLHFRWRYSSALLEGLGAPAALKLSKAILALVKASSASVDELRTAKGIRRADSLHISRDHRRSVAEKLVKLLRLAAKYSPESGGVIQPVRNREFEKTLAPEILLGEGGAEGGGDITDERLADYARVLGAVIAMNGPKSVVLSPDHLAIARDKAVACLGVAAEQLGKWHKRERQAARTLVRSLRANREASRRA